MKDQNGVSPLVKLYEKIRGDILLVEDCTRRIKDATEDLENEGELDCNYFSSQVSRLEALVANLRIRNNKAREFQSMRHMLPLFEQATLKEGEVS